MADICNEIIENGDLPASMTKAVTVFIKKKGDQLDRPNQRPVSLLKWLQDTVQKH